MSYIRCLSNPEGLYIWGDGKYANFTLASEPNFLDKIVQIPQKTFDNLLKKYIKNYGDNVNYRGASIKVVWVKTGKLHPKAMWEIIGKYDTDMKIRLSYKNWHIDMWLVTWEYITKRYKK